MKHWVYIIHSSVADKFYKGYSLDVAKRLAQHNNGESRYTSSFRPWNLVFIQSFDNKTDALKREKALKKYAKQQIIELCNSHLNEIKNYE